jgi:hypothetical protein
MDFSQARSPVDGIYPYILAVRDLASHQQLVWQPVPNERAETVLPILLELFAQHGPPLVLKSDNGSAFIAEVARSALQLATVTQLFSPAAHPQYNGALERSNGTLKTYTHQHAIGEGHPFYWSSEDLEKARELANHISRPWGHRGPSPQQVWQERVPLTAEARAVFQFILAQQRQDAAADLRLDLHDELSHADRSRLDRLAISRTLEQLGYLSKTRVTRPAKKPKRPKNLTHTAVTAALAESASVENAEPAKAPLIETRSAFSSPAPKFEPRIWLLASADDPGRLQTPALSGTILNKATSKPAAALPVLTTSGDHAPRQEPVGDECAPIAACRNPIALPIAGVMASLIATITSMMSVMTSLVSAIPSIAPLALSRISSAKTLATSSARRRSRREKRISRAAQRTQKRCAATLDSVDRSRSRSNNSAPSEARAEPPPLDENKPRLLAQRSLSATIQASGVPGEHISNDPPRTPTPSSAHWEPTPPSWSRRSITPLVQLLKAANILR